MNKRKEKMSPATETRQLIEQHLLRLGLVGLDIDAHIAWAKQQQAG